MHTTATPFKIEPLNLKAANKKFQRSSKFVENRALSERSLSSSSSSPLLDPCYIPIKRTSNIESTLSFSTQSRPVESPHVNPEVEG